MSWIDITLIVVQPLLGLALVAYHTHTMNLYRGAMEAKDRLIKTQNEMIDNLRKDRDNLLRIR